MTNLIVPEGFRKIDVPRVATMSGSDNDLVQMISAFDFLLRAAKKRKVINAGHFTNSIHRHPKRTREVLNSLLGNVDALIVGAGWANHLTGCVNALLRNEFSDDQIVVFGVAFEDPSNYKHTKAAIYSITELPSSEVVFRNYVGEAGCLRAAKDAVEGIYPTIKLKDYSALAIERSTEEALEVGEKLLFEKQGVKR